MAEGGHSEAGQDATVLHQQLEAAGTRLEELVEENEDLQIKCKELELRETTLQEVRGARGGTLLRDWSAALAAAAAAAAAADARRDARGAACRLNTAIDAALLPDALDSHHAHEFSFSSEDEAGDGRHGHHGRHSRHGTRHWHHGGSGGGGGGGGASASGGVNVSGGSGAVAASNGSNGTTSPASSAGEGGAQPAGARALSPGLPPADGPPVKHRPITPPRPKGGHGTPPPRVTFKDGDGAAPPRPAPARAGASLAAVE